MAWTLPLASPSNRSVATPIIPGQPVNGVLGNGADTGTLDDGTPFDAYTFTATQPDQRFTVVAVSPNIPLSSDVFFIGPTVETTALLQTATVYSLGRPVGQIDPLSQPGQHVIFVYATDLQQPSGSYRLTLYLTSPPTSAPPASAGQ